MKQSPNKIFIVVRYFEFKDDSTIVTEKILLEFSYIFNLKKNKFKAKLQAIDWSEPSINPTSWFLEIRDNEEYFPFESVFFFNREDNCTLYVYDDSSVKFNLLVLFEDEKFIKEIRSTTAIGNNYDTATCFDSKEESLLFYHGV